MRCQIWDIKDNLILKKDGSVFAIYRVPPKVINSVDDEAKENYKSLVYMALSKIRTYRDFMIKKIPINQDVLDRFNKLSADIDWEAGGADLAENVLNSMVNYLDDSIGVIHEYHYYIIVPLKSIHVSVDLKSVVKQSYQNVRNNTLALIGFGEQVPVDWHKKYKNQEKILDGALSMLGARALTTEENLFINLLQYRRGMQYDRKVEVAVVQNSMENLDDVNIEFEQVNIIKLSHFGQTSYLAFLPVVTLPENASYLHLEEELQMLNFPVESNFLVRFSVPKGAFSLLNRSLRARQRLKNAMEEAEEVDSVQKSSVIRSRFLLEDLQDKFNEDIPLVSYLETLVITDTSIEGLQNKYDDLYSKLNQMGVEIVKANADQVYLLYKNMIGQTLTSSDKNFIQSMSLEAFSENLFFMTRRVGNQVGFYAGRVDNQVMSWQGDYKKAIRSSSNPVYVNLLQANKQGVEDKVTSNPHVAITGETGMGKSFLTKLLFTYHSLLKAKILYVDPKAEMRRQYQKVLDKHAQAGTNKPLQDYIRSVDFVTLDARNPKNYGVLDPIVFLTGAEATDLADSMISSLLGKENSTLIRSVYLDAIDKVLTRRQKGDKVGMLHVFEEMTKAEHDEVVHAGKLLKRLVKNSISSLCFSDGQNESIDLTSKITILEISGLDLPKVGDSQELTESQRKSLTVMYALGYFCKRFGERDKTEETILFFDEAWFFNTTAIGRAILMELKRIGRSFNNFMVYITQSIHDLATTEDSTGFGTVFAFLEKTEIDDILIYLKIPVTEETREWLGNMTMGQCIYLDPFGRKERITVDSPLSDVSELYETVETKLKSVT